MRLIFPEKYADVCAFLSDRDRSRRVSGMLLFQTYSGVLESCSRRHDWLLSLT